MDEPFAAVDAMTRTTLQEDLLRLWRETGVSVLFVTHNIDEAVFLAQRVVVMGAGRHPRGSEGRSALSARPRVGGLRPGVRPHHRGAGPRQPESRRDRWRTEGRVTAKTQGVTGNRRATPRRPAAGGVVAHLDVAQHLGPGGQEHAVAHLRMAVASMRPGRFRPGRGPRAAGRGLPSRSRFNEARAFPPGKRWFPARPPAMWSPGFNEARAFPPGKRG